MIEQKSFMGSKLMTAENPIAITDQDIVYYQQLNGEQLNLNQEINISKIIFSSLTEKANNHQINLDATQTETDQNGRTKWIININLVEILRSYMFTRIKEKRSFGGILSEETSFKSIDDSIRQYLNNNIIGLYDFKNMDLYIEYLPLSEEEGKRYEVSYDRKVKEDGSKSSKFSLSFSKDRSYVQVFFTQEKNSKDFTFNYYFDLYYEQK
jgi:hypothetical protein